MISLAERRDLWAWQYAHRSFANCEAACRHLIDNRLTDTSPIYYSLTSAAYIAYARPFRKSYGLGQRSEVIVPGEKKALHALLLNTRDKVYAHVDADDILIWDGTPTVDVRIGVSETGVSVQALEVTPLPVGFDVIAELAKELGTKCQYHVEKIVKANIASFPKKPGNYHLSIKEGAVPFIPDSNDAPISW